MNEPERDGPSGADAGVEDRESELEAEVQHLREALAEARSDFERLGEGQAETVTADRMATLGRVVAGVAHELNTPLGALHSNHDVICRALERLQDILADERVDEEELDEVRRIVKAVDGVLATQGVAVERMRGLVDSLRSFGRPDRAERDRVDLHEGLEGTLALLRHEMEDRVAVQRDYGTLPPVECHVQQINQLFMNLLLNASQAIPEQGTIRIRTRAEDGTVRLAVTDDGRGIPGPVMERIFEPGFTTKGSRMGMGLGLLICRRIVDEHEGRLEVESEPGEGSTFTVILPVTSSAQKGGRT